MHRIYIPILVMLLVSGCAPSRRMVSTVTHVSDTLHVTVHDTVRITQLHDSIVFRASERSRTEQTTTFDPATGHPVLQHTVSEHELDLDALVRHIVDSIEASRFIAADAGRNDQDVMQQEEERGDPALSPLQAFARRIATLVYVVFVIFAVLVAIRLYLLRNGASRW